MWLKVMGPDKTTKESKLRKNGYKTVTIVKLIQNKSQNIHKWKNYSHLLKSQTTVHTTDKKNVSKNLKAVIISIQKI